MMRHTYDDLLSRMARHGFLTIEPSLILPVLLREDQLAHVAPYEPIDPRECFPEDYA